MIGSILVFLVVLSVLILIHEFGHFIVARRAGIWVEEFGFGLPPRLFGKKIGETIYSVNWLPFGGFVRLHGEQDEGGVTDKKRAFLFRDKRTRVGVIVAGVVMNFLLAIVAFAIVYSFSGIPKDTHKLRIVDVSPGSPAQSSGIVVGDVISKVGGEDVDSTESFIGKVNLQKGKTTSFEVQRSVNGEMSTLRLSITPRQNPPEGEGALGVTITTTEIYFPPVWARPFYGVYYGFKEAIFWGQTIAVGLWTIIGGLSKGQVPQGISGPVGIFAVTTEAARNGILTLVNFVGVLSVNLAILNILPFPALDGGRLFFIGLESVIGKKVVPRVEAVIHTVGMLFLLALLLAITVGDIKHLIAAGGVGGFLDSMVK